MADTLGLTSTSAIMWPDRTARVWDTASGQAITPPLKHDSLVVLAAYNPDGSQIFTVCENGKGRLWDARTGRPPTEPLDAGPIATDGCMDPAGQQIAICTESGTIRIWEVPTVPTPVPAWFADFAEAAGGLRLGHTSVDANDRMLCARWGSEGSATGP